MLCLTGGTIRRRRGGAANIAFGTTRASLSTRLLSYQFVGTVSVVPGAPSPGAVAAVDIHTYNIGPCIPSPMFWSIFSSLSTNNEVHYGPDTPLLTLIRPTGNGSSKLSMSAFLQMYCPAVYPAYRPSTWLPKYTTPPFIHCPLHRRRRRRRRL